MLSYRHAFHAGSHADVLKHFIEVHLLRYLAQKNKPYWYIDTHAGAGCYALDSGYAMQNAEHESGIALLWGRNDLPVPLAEYVALVRRINPDGQLKLYPGSPLIALELLRNQDRMRLYELHPSDSEILKQNFAGHGARVLVQAADGFSALKALLPPPSRRALVLIDPPYEDKLDYQRVLSALREGLKRFAGGVYAVWYPLLQRNEARHLPGQLKKLQVKSWLNVALSIRAPSDDSFGMHGSGIFILNPPWLLQGVLQEVMPYLVKVLGQNGEGSFLLEFEENTAT
ncbi:MAG TPA: 23S rRNA (adenine(2030)-N(6))-methyltransferase RlmJ [Gallionella sp.]|nr:23S rRNA (adenine(2030)-N(6))-methyltransferase RlmJ [Gallionella sp.]